MNRFYKHYDHESKAFQYEEGQFICHLYIHLPALEHEIINNFSLLISDHQESTNVPKWEFLDYLHITILRGHRAIYYHQIEPLFSALEKTCNYIKPFTVCLDDIKILSNYENTKHFACMVSTTKNEELVEFKRKIQETIDKFAIKLTNEDETDNTTLHCSFMVRSIESSDNQSESAMKVEEESLRDMCIQLSKAKEIPILFSHVEKIYVRIGQKMNYFNLKG